MNGTAAICFCFGIAVIGILVYEAMLHDYSACGEFGEFKVDFKKAAV